MAFGEGAWLGEEVGLVRGVGLVGGQSTALLVGDTKGEGGAVAAVTAVTAVTAMTAVTAVTAVAPCDPVCVAGTAWTT